jgi:hypothetical protein
MKRILRITVNRQKIRSLGDDIQAVVESSQMMIRHLSMKSLIRFTSGNARHADQESQRLEYGS